MKIRSCAQAAGLLATLGVAGLAVPAAAGAAVSGTRGYELVSPADAGGAALLFPSGDGLPRPLYDTVSTDGNSTVFGSSSALPGLPVAGRTGESYIATRGATGWAIRSLAPGGTVGNELSGGGLSGVSPDLQRVYMLWQQGIDVDPADPDVPDPDLGSQTMSDIYEESAEGALRWISRGSISVGGNDAPIFQAASDDGSVVAFSWSRRLEPAASGAELYARWHGRTEVVSVDPDGNPLADAPQFDGMSSDGHRIVFANAGANGVDTPVLLRELSDAGSQTIDASQGEAARYEGMSRDGGTIVFSSAAALTTAGDQDTDTSRDLFAFDVASRTVTRLSTGAAGSGNSDACTSSYGDAGCSVRFVNASPDGSHVFFISPEQLDGSKGAPGEPNLYVHDAAGTTFVATLSTQDLQQNDPRANVPPYLPSGLDWLRSVNTSRTTPDGKFLAFESFGPQRPGLSPPSSPYSEIYRYDVDADQLVCVSCRASVAPAGNSLLSVWSLIGQAGRGPNMTADGSEIFFESPDALAAGDTNGKIDVYEWTDGTPRLISSGRSQDDSTYWGNSDDGRDVFFFSSSDDLVPAGQDTNGRARKLFDARVGGGFPDVAPAPAPCEGEACRPDAPSPPPAAPPGSDRFFGPGNLPASVAARPKPASFSVARPARKALVATAGSGRLTVRVTTNGASTVSLRATAKLPGHQRSGTVASGSRRSSKAQTVSVALRLSAAARRVLAQGRTLTVRLQARDSRVKAAKTLTLNIKRAARSNGKSV
jgi:hypothetical protein